MRVVSPPSIRSNFWIAFHESMRNFKLLRFPPSQLRRQSPSQCWSHFIWPTIFILSINYWLPNICCRFVFVTLVTHAWGTSVQKVYDHRGKDITKDYKQSNLIDSSTCTYRPNNKSTEGLLQPTNQDLGSSRIFEFFRTTIPISDFYQISHPLDWCWIENGNEFAPPLNIPSHL